MIRTSTLKKKIIPRDVLERLTQWVCWTHMADPGLQSASQPQYSQQPKFLLELEHTVAVCLPASRQDGFTLTY